MACLHVGSAVHHGRRHDLTPDSCKGLTFDPFRASAISGRTHNREYPCNTAPWLLGTHFALSHRLRRPRPIWTSLTASVANSITYNYVRARMSRATNRSGTALPA